MGLLTLSLRYVVEEVRGTTKFYFNQKGPIYRQIKGKPVRVAPNILFVPTTTQLGLLDVIPDGRIKYSYNPPASSSQYAALITVSRILLITLSEKRAGISHTWGFNYDTNTKRARIATPILQLGLILNSIGA